jgi:hypothetical protein
LTPKRHYITIVSSQWGNINLIILVMKILRKEKGFELQQIGNFFQVIDNHDNSWGYKDTLRKANNLFNKIISNYE